MNKGKRALIGSAVAGIALATTATGASSAWATAAFHVSGAAANGNARGDLWLDGVSFDSGATRTISNQFVYPSDVTDFTYSGWIDQIRVVSGTQTQGTTGYHPLEDMDGNSANLTALDLMLFNDAIEAAFSNNNLNNYLDHYANGESFSFSMHFDGGLHDDDAGQDGIGELLFFERGPGGSNSAVTLQAEDALGNLIGLPYVISPNGTHQPKPLSPPSGVSVFTIWDVEGTGVQAMEGMAVDLSSAFGLSTVERIRVSTLADPAVFGDRAPDFKILGLDTVVPEPGSVVLIALGGWTVLRRQRR